MIQLVLELLEVAVVYVLNVQSEVALVFYRIKIYAIVRSYVHIARLLRLLLLSVLVDCRVLAAQSVDRLLSSLLNVLVHLLIVLALLLV